jgi:hypothetical protein
MTTTIAAVESPSIRHGEFIRINVDGTYYTYCNAAGPITVNGITFLGYGSFLQLGSVQRNIKSSSDDLLVGISGLDTNNVALILSSNIKGSIVEVWRGFFDSNNQIQTIDGTQQFFKRYQGIINNVSITEEFDAKARIRTATCIMNCASFRTILQNRISGIRTNPTQWQTLHPSDTSMNRVPAIVGQYFDFGKEPMRNTQSTTGSSSDTSSTVNTDGGGS